MLKYCMSGLFFLNDRKVCFELVSLYMELGSMKIRVVWDEGMNLKTKSLISNRHY